MASLAVAAALIGVEHPDLPSICPLSVQWRWVWFREPKVGESLVLLVLKIFIRITGSEKWRDTSSRMSSGILFRNRLLRSGSVVSRKFDL